MTVSFLLNLHNFFYTTMDGASQWLLFFGAYDYHVEHAALKLYVIVSICLESKWQLSNAEQIADGADRLRSYHKGYGEKLLKLINPKRFAQVEGDERDRLYIRNYRAL